MVIGQIGEESYRLQALPVLIIIPDDNFLNGFSEGLPINKPQIWYLASPHRIGSLGIVQESQLAKP